MRFRLRWRRERSSSRSFIGPQIFQRETAYGAGITPIGLQLDFANGSKVHPFAHLNGGFLYFNKSMPIEDSGQFRICRRSRRRRADIYIR